MVTYSEMTRQKGGIGVLGLISSRKMTRKYIAGGIMEDKGYFSKGVYANSSLCRLLISSDKTALFLVQGGHVAHEKLCPL